MLLLASPDNDHFQSANNKGTDQTVQVHRLVYASVAHKPLKRGFMSSKPI